MSGTYSDTSSTTSGREIDTVLDMNDYSMAEASILEKERYTEKSLKIREADKNEREYNSESSKQTESAASSACANVALRPYDSVKQDRSTAVDGDSDVAYLALGIFVAAFSSILSFASLCCFPYLSVNVVARKKYIMGCFIGMIINLAWAGVFLWLQLTMVQ